MAFPRHAAQEIALLVPIQRLGICAAASNITSFLTSSVTDLTISMSLTNGVVFDIGTFIFYYLDIQTLLNRSLGFLEATNPLVNIYILEGNNQHSDNYLPPTATEIMLQACILNLQTVVVEGNTITTVLSYSNYSKYDESQGILHVESPDGSADPGTYIMWDLAKCAFANMA